MDNPLTSTWVGFHSHNSLQVELPPIRGDYFTGVSFAAKS